MKTFEKTYSSKMGLSQPVWRRSEYLAKSSENLDLPSQCKYWISADIHNKIKNSKIDSEVKVD